MSELASIWGRRAISIPALFTAATCLLLCFPVWLVLALLTDVATGTTEKWPKTRALAFFALYLVCEVTGVCAAATLWGVTIGGRLGGPTTYQDANASLQRVWSSTLFNGAIRIFAMTVEVSGAENAVPGPAVFLVRHSSTADTALTAALIANPAGIRLRYVLKRELLWDPCLDIVGRRLPNAFIDRSAARRGDDLAAIARLATGLDEHSGVLIYPEGTRFTPDKAARSLTRLRGRGSDELARIAATYKSVLPPRTAGVLALLEAAPDAAVVLVEHRGFEGAATFPAFWRGGLVGQTLRVRLRRFAPAEIPTHRRDVWLFERWRELDLWLDEPAHGSYVSPSSADTARSRGVKPAPAEQPHRQQEQQGACDVAGGRRASTP